MISIKKGLDIPIAGAPAQAVSDGPKISRVALLGDDYVGMKPTMLVAEGDSVVAGQPLFEDKKNPGVLFTAPASGTVAAVNRGERRKFLSLVIDVDDSVPAKTFAAHDVATLANLDAAAVESQLVESGLWAALRTRPFSKTPALNSRPEAIFVSTMDSNPLAGDPMVVVAEQLDMFKAGLNVLSTLSEKLFVCSAPDNAPDLSGVSNVTQEQFSGPHPAGLSGTHIHFLRPASVDKVVWTVGAQDVIAIGALFSTGELWLDRVVALGGPQVEKPRLLKTRLGADLEQFTAGELSDGENRLVSGSVLSGRNAGGVERFLGRYHTQVSVLEEGRDRPMLHYVVPGKNRFSALPIYLSRLNKKRKWNFTTTTNGSDRAMVPIGAYESVMPLDVLPTQLLRSLIVGDTLTAQQLGALELDEEDLALCTFVCPGKYEFGPILRDNLTRIEEEG